LLREIKVTPDKLDFSVVWRYAMRQRTFRLAFIAKRILSVRDPGHEIRHVMAAMMAAANRFANLQNLCTHVYHTNCLHAAFKNPSVGLAED